MEKQKINIAIDGYSSCGKSTLAKELAEALGYRYIDSGAMYRAITLYLLRHEICLDETSKIEEALKDIHLSFHVKETSGKSEIYLNGENVEPYIRDMIVAEKVSIVAAVAAVRRFAVRQQQEMGKDGGVIMDGRDIGTVVFPDAALKIFMTAAPEVRVMRRYQELVEKNPEITVEDVMKNLELRDYTDSNRKESPLRQAADARVLDNSDISRDDQLKLVLSWVEETLHKTAPIEKS